MKEITVAFATDDGSHFINRHFGDAEFYKMYSISPMEIKYLKQIKNTTEEDDDDDGHGYKKKAGGITAILKGEGFYKIIKTKYLKN